MIVIIIIVPLIIEHPLKVNKKFLLLFKSKSVKQSGGTKTLSLDNIKVTSGACKNSKNSVEKHLTL